MSGKSSSLAVCLVGIMTCNLAWSYFQERVGATKYCDASGEHCEKFKSIPVMNMVQALAASMLGYSLWQMYSPAATVQPKTKTSGTALTFWDFLPASLCHTIASPIGYTAMRYIPYPFYMCVSTAKFVPVLIVGWIVNGATPTWSAIAAASVMLTGIVLYSSEQLAKTTLVEHPGMSALTQLLTGVGVTLVNLSMEGYTNAGQDQLRKKAGDMGKDTYQYQLMAMMNGWSVVLLSVFLTGEAAVRGQESYLLSALSFAQRHPAVITHISGFALLGALAQIFIFKCISEHGTFTTTTITVSRKFVTVLLSVYFFQHVLTLPQWVGVVLVFSGLGIQLSSGGGHGHGHAAPATGSKKKD